ncbi:MAG: M28 family peptidase [Gemmatimonas sp.]|nr:M28 family peptidase [Gemmatimonas sp.]
MIRCILTGVCAGTAVACSGPGPAAQQASPPAEIAAVVDSARVLSDLQFLSSPALEGRRAGSQGNDAARAYIESELMQASVETFAGGWSHPFEVGSGDGTIQGENVLGVVRGTTRPGRYIVVSAHYDHLGRSADEIYHGADDNASGTAALLEIARQLTLDPPRNSVVLAALDAEEMGLQGARAFLEDSIVPLDSIVLNVNMDMVGRNEAGEIYVAGTYHYPFLNEYVESVAAGSGLRVLRGHDRPDLSAGDDWTMASDHGPFHAAGIPFAYFGVEDHADYHQPTDTFERIDPAFFVEAVRMILAFVREVDGAADQIAEAAGR